MLRTQLRVVAVLTLALAACSGTDPAADAGDTATPDDGADLPPDDGPGPDTDADVADDGAPDGVFDECPAGETTCVDHATRRWCEATAAGTRWREEPCPAGEGCLAGACGAACADECNLGETGAAGTCGLLDLATGAPVAPDPVGSLHDRARAYEQRLRRDGLLHGGVGNARYADPPAYARVIGLDGLGDSAIWTGTYLAAEALRLMATGSPDARTQVEALVRTLHRWFNVPGTPGLLARFVAPAGGDPLAGELDCAARRVHCDVEYDGARWDYLGHISRDQYQGVLLGYALAYEALGEAGEAVRALIREDVVEFVHELMRERTLRMRLIWDGTPVAPFDVRVRFMVEAPAEMVDGAVELSLSSSGVADGEMYGFQEFVPDLALVVRQFPLLGWVPSIPRADSGIMLASFFRVALLVTAGVAEAAADHEAFAAFYYGNADDWGNVGDWLDVAARWSYLGECGNGYYATNIAMEPMYNLARLEDDAATADRVLREVLEAGMWPELASTKNCFFSYIFAGTVPWADPAVAEAATAQLRGFPPPPRVHVGVDLLADPRYAARQAGCENQLDHGQAVDVADRMVSDFIWQRHPWGLLDGGDPARTYPGVDYLVAYWLGRRHGFLADDTPGRCLAWH